jgi:hypothetical protein
MFWKTWFKRTQFVKPSRYQDVFDNLDQVNLQTVFSSDKSILKITVGKTNVIEYTKHLNLIIQKFENSTLLYVYEVDPSVKIIFVRDFFIDSQGCFTDPEEVFTLFRTSVKRFLSLYEECEMRADKSFEIEKNLLLSQHLVNNLVILSKELRHGL